MAGNEQKTPFIKGMNGFVDSKTQTAIDLLAKSAPAEVVSVDETGTIVTVKLNVQSNFPLPQIICPVATTEFARAPIGPGTTGALVPTDLYLGGVSELGGGTATDTPMPNLSTCYFVPLGNAGLFPTDDPNAYLVYGPNGVIARDRGNNGPGIEGSSVQMKVDAAGNATLWGFKTLTLDCGGYGQRITNNGGGSFTIDNYTQGATVVTNDLPYSPDGKIPDPS